MPDSLLRDLNREQAKMQGDVNNLHRHYEQLQGYVQQYIEQTTIEWSKLVVDHPKAHLLIVETTRVTDKNGSSYGESEPIRFTSLGLAGGEIWDQLIYPSHSELVTGTEYHGLTMAHLDDKPRLRDVWSSIVEVLAGRHLIIFGADYARNALRTAYQTHLLDDAYCLHNKCKEYYGEFYELSLDKVLGYQGIDKTREQLKDSRERILMLAQVISNLAAGMKKQSQESNEPDESLDDHPF